MHQNTNSIPTIRCEKIVTYHPATVFIFPHRSIPHRIHKIPSFIRWKISSSSHMSSIQPPFNHECTTQLRYLASTEAHARRILTKPLQISPGSWIWIKIFTSDTIIGCVVKYDVEWGVFLSVVYVTYCTC